jgi:hypothetical protein
MPLPNARPFTAFNTVPPVRSGSEPFLWSEEASAALLMEALGRHSALKSVGTAKMSGSATHINRLWINYRNFVRQAMSNFGAAMGVGNRSSSLLYYYAMLNFAKAELLNQHHTQILDQLIKHGLSFHPVRAKSVAGDYLKVTSGVFPLLYERRTGYTLPVGTRLPLKRLLCAIPEIGTQLGDSGFADANFATADVAIVSNNATQETWILMRVDPNFIKNSSATKLKVLKYFKEVEAPQTWKDIFSISKRLMLPLPIFLESKRVLPSAAPLISDTLAILDDISDVFDVMVDGAADAIFTPYLPNKLVMPPSLARYAVTYYASSLVRYRPSAFDADRSPEQAYLFDAVARECALPMLIDTLTQLEGRPQLFFPGGSLRV